MKYTNECFAGLLALLLILVPGVGLGASESRYHDLPDTAIAPARFPADYQSPGKKPPEGQAIRKYADDQPGRGPGNFGMLPVHDDPFFATVRADRLEVRSTAETEENVFLWDMQAWAGWDYEKIYLESEGERENGAGEPESANVEFLYGWPITPFWDVRVGARQTIEPEPDRTFGVIGLTGLAPQWFETATNFLVGESDDVRADLELEYNLLLSQRLVFQSRLETQFSFQEQPELELGDGFTDVELGGRLRYEFNRKFTPYVGVSWESKLGETRDIAQSSGTDPDAFFVVAGLRFWY